MLLIFAGKGGKAASYSDDETRVKALVESLDGVEDASVLISVNLPGDSFSVSGNKEKTVCGIAVSARGADLPENKKKIIDLLSAAFSLPTNKICVCGK